MKITTRINRELDVKVKGITFSIHTPNGKTHIGNLTLTKTKLIWCPDKTARKDGRQIKLEDFIKWAEAQQ